MPTQVVFRKEVHRYVVDFRRYSLKLDAVGLSGDTLLYMERYVDEGAKNYSPLSSRTEASPQYQPRNERECFDLVTVRAPKERVSVFQADPQRRLLEHYMSRDEVLFAVHPETWNSPGIEHLDDLHALPLAQPIPVAPTASTRTVLTLDNDRGVSHHFIKLHYPRRISRFNRTLRRQLSHDSISIARDLTHV